MRCQGRQSPILSTQELPLLILILPAAWGCSGFVSAALTSPPLPLFWADVPANHPSSEIPAESSILLLLFPLFYHELCAECHVHLRALGIDVCWAYQEIHFIKPGPYASLRWSFPFPSQPQELCSRIMALQFQIPMVRGYHGEAVRDTISSNGTGGSFVWSASVPQKRDISVKWGSQGIHCGACRVWTSTLKVEGILDGCEREWEFENWG